MLDTFGFCYAVPHNVLKPVVCCSWYGNSATATCINGLRDSCMSDTVQPHKKYLGTVMLSYGIRRKMKGKIKEWTQKTPAVVQNRTDVSKHAWITVAVRDCITTSSKAMNILPVCEMSTTSKPFQCFDTVNCNKSLGNGRSFLLVLQKKYYDITFHHFYLQNWGSNFFWKLWFLTIRHRAMPQRLYNEQMNVGIQILKKLCEVVDWTQLLQTGLTEMHLSTRRWAFGWHTRRTSWRMWTTVSFSKKQKTCSLCILSPEPTSRMTNLIPTFQGHVSTAVWTQRSTAPQGSYILHPSLSLSLDPTRSWLLTFYLQPLSLYTPVGTHICHFTTDF
jgi:hypothetical protein